MSDSYTRYFAEIYDDIMDAVPYDSWFNYLKDLINYYRADKENILELACGTANMTERLSRLKKVKHITAVDLSPEMLKKAVEKINTENTEVEFVQEDMKEIKFDKKFSLIVSFFDSINYLTEEEDLARLFNNAVGLLKQDGLFIFDMNSIGRINTIEEKKFVLEGKNYTCFWEDIIDLKQTTWKVQLKIYFNDDQSQYFEEIHKETGYKKEDIISLLTSVGFSKVKVYKAFTFDEGKDSDNRLYYVVCKNNLQEKKLSLLNRFKKKVKWKFLSSCD